MTGVGTQGLRWFITKLLGYLVEPQNQDRRLDGRRRDTGAPRTFDTSGHVVDHRACIERTRTAAKVWPSDEEECYLTYLPLRGLYYNLSARGSLVICPAQRDSYINSRVFGQTILPDCFSFPCFIGLDFSPVCKESDLRVNGSFHGCVDYPLVARVILMSFLSYFRWIFVRALFLQF
jgi:hypothetical protein